MLKFDYCEKCPLKDAKLHSYVPPVQQSDIVVVCETPLSRAASSVLDMALKQSGLSGRDICITSAVQCVIENQRPPKPLEIATCRERLFKDLGVLSPKVIIALGKIAVKAVLQLSKSIKEERGTIHSLTLPNGTVTHVVITYNPAAILRSPRLSRDFYTDVTNAVALIKGKTFVEIQADFQIEYKVITAMPDLIRFLQDTNNYPSVALDVETDSKKDLLCLGLSIEAAKAVVIAGEALDRGRRLIDVWLSNKVCGGQNLKSDIQILRKYGIKNVSTGWDTMLESYTMCMLISGHGLKHMVREHLNFQEDYFVPVKKYIAELENCPPELLYKYNAYDAALTWLLHDHFLTKLDAHSHRALVKLLYPASDALAEMEYNGITIDVPHTEGLNITLAKDLQDLRINMQEVAGMEFNPNSTQQVANILYNKLGLPIPKRWSTDADALELLVRFTDHTLPKLLLQYRDLNRFHNTYVKKFLEIKDSQDRVRTTFNLHTTVTGRTSSSNPINLQNITRTTDARNIFKATPGYTLIECDESQAEIRAWAWLSRDSTLRDVLVSGEDIHTATACLMFGLTPDKVTPDLRTAAKRLAFGTLFMMTPQTLASELGVSIAKAEELQNKFFGAYKQGRLWISKIQQQILADGYYLTHFGRKLQFANIIHNKNEVMRQAVNYPIQNLASEITILALIRLHEAIKKKQLGDTRLLLTVHDSVITETAEKNVRDVAIEMKRIMDMNVLDDWLPFLVDVKAGSSWGNTTKDF